MTLDRLNPLNALWNARGDEAEANADTLVSLLQLKPYPGTDGEKFMTSRGLVTKELLVQHVLDELGLY